MQDLNKPIVVDGVTYEPDEFYKRTLLVHGAEPTNYEEYQYINVLVNHKNRNDKAGGMAQAEYRYINLDDLKKFHSYQYPYMLDVAMITARDRKGRQVQVIIWADFDNVKEMELVERKQAVKTVTPTK